MGQEGVKKTFFHRFFNPLNTKIVSLSKNHSKDIQKYLGFTTQVIPWFIHPNDFPPINSTTIDILGVGSLNKIKNYDAFIDVIFHLRKKHLNIKVEILGGGSYFDRLQNKINQLELQENIKLIGQVSRDLVLKKMSQSHILLHTSDYESFGYVFLEALFSGMYVVSKNVGLSDTSPNWNVCSSIPEMVTACSSFLIASQTKKRILVYSEKECLSAYEQLYDSTIMSFKNQH